MIGERNIFTQNVCKRGIAILALKGRCAVKHFIDENAERPPVNSASMAATLNNLWRNVFLCADKRVGSEVGDARSRINGGESVGPRAILAHNHGRLPTEIRLLGQVEI